MLREVNRIAMQQMNQNFCPSSGTITNLCVDGGHDVETSIDPSEHA